MSIISYRGCVRKFFDCVTNDVRNFSKVTFFWKIIFVDFLVHMDGFLCQLELIRVIFCDHTKSWTECLTADFRLFSVVGVVDSPLYQQRCYTASHRQPTRNYQYVSSDPNWAIGGL